MVFQQKPFRKSRFHLLTGPAMVLPANVSDLGYVHTITNICLVCYTATAVLVLSRAGALRDDTKNGCVAD